MIDPLIQIFQEIISNACSQSDTNTNEYYLQAFRQLAPQQKTFSPTYAINIPVSATSSKAKYYARRIDNAVTDALNTRFRVLNDEQATNDTIAYQQRDLENHITSLLRQTQEIIRKNQYRLETITAENANFADSKHQADCTYMTYYLRTAFICCYLEFQSHYKSVIEPDKQWSISDIYQQILETPTPSNTLIQELTDNPLPYASVAAATPQNTHFQIFMEKTNAFHFAELEKYKVLAPESKLELIDRIMEEHLSWAVAMLHFLGYPQRLGKAYKMSKIKQYRHIAELLNSNERMVKGNLLTLDSNSDENRETYTAHKRASEVEQYYNSLTKA